MPAAMDRALTQRRKIVGFPVGFFDAGGEHTIPETSGSALLILVKYPPNG